MKPQHIVSRTFHGNELDTAFVRSMNVNGTWESLTADPLQGMRFTGIVAKRIVKEANDRSKKMSIPTSYACINIVKTRGRRAGEKFGF